MNNSGGQSGLVIDASITRRGLQKRPALIDGALTEHCNKPGHDIAGAVSTVTVFLFCFFFPFSRCPWCAAVKGNLLGFIRNHNVVQRAARFANKIRI